MLWLLDALRFVVMIAGVVMIGAMLAIGWRLRGNVRAYGCWSLAAFGITSLMFEGQQVGERDISPLLGSIVLGVYFGLRYVWGFRRDLDAFARGDIDP